MKYLASAFSLGMLVSPKNVIEVAEIPPQMADAYLLSCGGAIATTVSRWGKRVKLSYIEEKRVSRDEVKYMAEARWAGTSAIGHQGTVDALNERFVGKFLDLEPLVVNRMEIKLQPGDEVVVAQPIGRQPVSGAEVEAPDLKFFFVKVLVPQLSSEEKLRRERDPLWMESID